MRFSQTLLAGFVFSLASRTVIADGTSFAGYNSAGCYSDSGDMKLAKVETFQTSGACKNTCSAKNKKVMGLHNRKECWCGDKLPSKGKNKGKCSESCPGFGSEKCGDKDSWTVYTMDGYEDDSSSSTVSSSASSTSTSSSSSSSTSGASSTVSSAEASATSSAAKESASGSEQKKATGISGGAIAGIVVGIVGALALAGGAFVFFKKRRQNDEYNPSSSPHGFADPYGYNDDKSNPFGTGSSTGSGYNNNTNNNNGQSPFGSSRGNSQNAGQNAPANGANGANGDNFVAVDQRLNPVMLGERRISDGSLADEQDYSRKILRVANPDA